VLDRGLEGAGQAMRKIAGAQRAVLGAWVPLPLVPLAVCRMPRRHAATPNGTGEGGEADGEEAVATVQDRTEALEKTRRRRCFIEMEKAIGPSSPPATAKGTLAPGTALPSSNQSALLAAMSRVDAAAGSTNSRPWGCAGVHDCHDFRGFD
jgi:hypothetical protein